MAAYAFSIGGSSRDVLIEGVSIAETANGADTLTCSVRSLAGSYRPAINDTLLLTENGTRIFGGLVEAVTEVGANHQGNTVGLLLAITAKSFDVYAQRRLITVTLAAGSLESQLNTLITEFSSYGTAMHASQATGPTMPALSFTKVRGDEILNELASVATGNDTAGWTWRIDENNKLRFAKADELAAPFNVVNTDGNAKGDIEVETTRNDLYANRIYVIVSSGPATSTETFVAADGVTSGGFIYFNAKYPASSNINDLYPNVLLIDGVVSGVIGFGGNLPAGNWDWDHANHRLVFTIGSPYDFPTGAEVLSITYAIAYPVTAQADDAAGQAAYGLWERTVTPPNVLTLAAAQDYADGLLAQQSPTKQMVRYQTDEMGITPGMYQTVTVTKRNINATVLVQEVNTRALTSTLFHRDVTAVTTDAFQGTFRGTLDQWMSAGRGGAPPSGSAAGGAASPPLRSVQYNAAGAFAGSSELTFASGTTYAGFAGQLEVASKSDDSVYNLILKAASGDFVAFQVYQTSGDFYVTQQDGDMIFQAAENISMDAGTGHFTVDIGTQYTHHARLRGLASIYGLATSMARTTSTSYTMDSAGSPIMTLLADATGGAITVALPALANAGVTPASTNRLLCVVNDGSANNVTLDGNSSETINGAATYALTPGQSVIIQAWNGTNPGWKILANF